MLKSRLSKKIVSKEFFISIAILLFLFVMGKADYYYDGTSEGSVLSYIIMKIKGNEVHNPMTFFPAFVNTFLDNNIYTAVLMPFIVCFPFVSEYLNEIRNGNKRFVITRGSRKSYYLSEIFSNIIVTALVCVIAVLLYEIIIILSFDPIDVNNPDFGYLHMVLTGRAMENPESVNLSELYGIIVKNFLGRLSVFILYAVQCCAFCQAVVIMTRDLYLTLGITSFFNYFHQRIYAAVVLKAYQFDDTKKKVFSDIINPGFIYSAGKWGFYEKRIALAFLIEFVIIAFWIFLYYTVSEGREDVSQG